MVVSMVPEIVPLRDLQARMSAILDRLRQGPVVLTRDDGAAAVMVEPETWNIQEGFCGGRRPPQNPS